MKSNEVFSNAGQKSKKQKHCLQQYVKKVIGYRLGALRSIPGKKQGDFICGQCRQTHHPIPTAPSPRVN